MSLLLSKDFVVFTTRQYAVTNKQSVPSASRALNRMAKRDILIKFTKGVWANTQHPYFTPLALVPLLLGNEQGYVSFLTALHRHGAISQIPVTLQVATTGHTRKLQTPFGTVEFIQIKPNMMREGIEWSDTSLPYRIATAEKALIDLVYISTRKGRRFSKLPEIDFKFDAKTLTRLVRTIRGDRIRAAIENRLQLLNQLKR